MVDGVDGVGVVGFSAEVVNGASLQARTVVEASSRTNRAGELVGVWVEREVVFIPTPLCKAENRE